MKWANRLRRWTMRGIHAMILGASLVGSSRVAFGQTPTVAAAKLPPQVYSRNLAFELPMNMSDVWRAKVSEFRLYSRTPMSGWKLQDSGKQTLQKFDCKVPADGEYWFTLMTIDLQGKATPSDVNAEPPSQRVIVDTTPPAISVAGTTHEESVCLRCTMQDANPDPGTLRAFYKTEDAEIPLDTVANQPGMFKLKGPELMRYPVIVAGTDLAKNVGTKEINVQELVKAMLTPAAKVEPLVPSVPPPLTAKVEPLAPSVPPLVAGTPLPAPRSEGTPLPAPRIKALPLAPAKNEPVTKVQPQEKLLPATVQRVESPSVPPMPNRAEIPTLPPLNLAGHAATGVEPNINVPNAPAVSPAPLPAATDNATRGSVPYQLIGATHATLDYRIDQVGPSGVGKVEIYMTPDKGQTWHRMGEDVDKRSPADLNFPGDGVYGIRIVLTNGNGFGGRKPARGDAPDCEIEVDTTSPFVQLRSTDLSPSTGQVEIRWNANDRNFGTSPINLFYRTRIDAPWQVVARGLKNDGHYGWAFPREGSAQFFFKIEATDQAGNVSQDTSRQPIAIDLSEPRATVLGITGSGGVVRPVSGRD